MEVSSAIMCGKVYIIRRVQSSKCKHRTSKYLYERRPSVVFNHSVGKTLTSLQRNIVFDKKDLHKYNVFYKRQMFDAIFFTDERILVYHCHVIDLTFYLP